MTDLDAARQRISDLEDNAARLEGRMGVALNRIRVLEDELHTERRAKGWVRGEKHAAEQRAESLFNDNCTLRQERDALLEGLSSCVRQLENYNQEPVEAYKQALTSAQALLWKVEPTIAEMSGLVEDFTQGVPLKEYLDALRGSDDAPSSAAATITEAIRKMMANPELLERFNNLTADEARELLSSNPAHWGTAGQKAIPNPTERPIQVGDTVRHKTEGWEKTVKRILPALPEKSLAVMALFDGGDRSPLSELERVETAEPEPGR